MCRKRYQLQHGLGNLASFVKAYDRFETGFSYRRKFEVPTVTNIRVERGVYVMRNLILIGWIVAALTALDSEFAHADVVKWTTADGRIHYGDSPPDNVNATVMVVRHNVIETGQDFVPIATVSTPTRERKRSTTYGESPRRRNLQAYIEHCRANRGVYCETEARQMIDGPAPVFFPGDPAIFPRPDLKPPPPGLPLKFSITP